MRRMLASLAVALTMVGATSACINDSELPGHEREFKSSYQRQAAPEPAKDSYFSPQTGPLAILGASGFLAVGAVAFVIRKPSAKG
jgi:hypothetical protein